MDVINELNDAIENQLLNSEFNHGKTYQELLSALRLAKESIYDYFSKKSVQANELVLPNEVVRLIKNIKKLEIKLGYEEEKPKTLVPYSSLDRGKALSNALSANFNNYKEGLQREKEARYQEMIDELPPIQSPMDRRK